MLILQFWTIFFSILNYRHEGGALKLFGTLLNLWRNERKTNSYDDENKIRAIINGMTIINAADP